MRVQQIKLSDWVIKWQMKFSASKCENGKRLHMGKKHYLCFISVYVLTKNLLLLSVLHRAVQMGSEGEGKQEGSFS